MWVAWGSGLIGWTSDPKDPRGDEVSTSTPEGSQLEDEDQGGGGVSAKIEESTKQTEENLTKRKTVGSILNTNDLINIL